MAKRNEIYKCAVCGKVVEVLRCGEGELVCCGKPMMLMTENTSDGAKEKHVPVVEKIEGGYKVTVGSIDHPMSEEHHIEWIELRTKCGKLIRKCLKPGDKPIAKFKTDATEVCARAYCNLHGLWKCACDEGKTCCSSGEEKKKINRSCDMGGNVC